MTWTEEELRRRVAAAYDDVLDEPVPDRLGSLFAPPPARVVDLAAERARRAVPAAQRRPAVTWAQWGGMAASLAIGVFAGMQFVPHTGDEALLVERAGRVVAGAPLRQALESQLASEPASARVAVQLSFVDRAGRYCRTFSAEQVAGLACHDGAQWSVVTTAQAAQDRDTAMRQAATSLPRPVLAAVDAQIAGSALNAAQERDARDRGWH